jgi:hypothetical protein
MGSQIQEIIVGAGGAIGMNFLANYVANTLLKITDANTKLALKVAMAVGVPVLLAPKLKNKSLKGAVVTGSVVLGALAVKDFITPSLPASLQGDELTESEKALLNAYADIASAPSLHGNHGHALLGAQNLMYGDHEHALLGAQNLMFGEPEENLLGAQHAIYGDDSMSDDWSGNAHLNGEYNAF